MNSQIVKSLLGLVYPVESVSLKMQSVGMEMYELQRLLCANPSMKIIELYSVNGIETLAPAANSRPTFGNSQRNNELKSNPLLKSITSVIPKYDKGLVKQFVS